MCRTLFASLLAIFSIINSANAGRNLYVRIKHTAYEKSELTSQSAQELFEALAARTADSALRGARFECVDTYKGTLSGEACQTEGKLFKHNPDFRDYANNDKYSYMSSIELNCLVPEENIPFFKRKLWATEREEEILSCL